jgi:hypothetical protein
MFCRICPIIKTYLNGGEESLNRSYQEVMTEKSLY